MFYSNTAHVVRGDFPLQRLDDETLRLRAVSPPSGLARIAGFGAALAFASLAGAAVCRYAGRAPGRRSGESGSYSDLIALEESSESVASEWRGRELLVNDAAIE